MGWKSPKSTNSPSNTWFLRPTQIHIPNGNSIGSAVVTGSTMCPTQRSRHNKLYLALVPRAAMQSKQPSDGDSLENHCHRVFPVLALKRQRPSQHLKLHITATQWSRHNTPSLNLGFIQFNSNKSASTLVHQITAWCCPLLSSVANQLHVAATVNWWDREMDGHHTVTAESRQLVEPGNRICVKVWMEMLMLRPPVSNKNKNHFYCILFSQIREILVPQFD